MKTKTKAKSGRPGKHAQRKSGSPTAKLHVLAQQTERQLNIIQRSMRQRLQAEFARGNLTGPQRLVMGALVRSPELSLKQLSEAVSLAHSTVSGIVDRLVKQSMIERRTHPTDRRITVLAPSEPVRTFMKTSMPELALHPLLEALRHASPAEQKSITSGLDTLIRLMSVKEIQPNEKPFDEFDQ